MSISYFAAQEGKSEIMCLSTDTKPTNVPANAVLIEEDTGKQFRYESNVWVEKLNSSYALSAGSVAAANVTGTLAVVQGGTGASNATVARTNLGLGDVSTISTNASTVNFLRGDGTWVTPSAASVDAPNITGTVAIVQGGTGASNAGVARTNLGLGSLATLSSVTLVTNTTGTLSVAQGGTGASSGSAAYTNLGTMSSSNLSGTISVVGGGTNASDAVGARSNLGLGTMATKSSITLVTDTTGTLSVAQGGTGASSGTAAYTNLGSMATTNLSGTLSVASGGTGASSGPAAYTNLGTMGASNISGTLAVVNGGTGASNGTSAYTNLGAMVASNLSGTVSVANGGTGVSQNTGSGAVVLNNSPTFVSKVTLPAGTSSVAPLVFTSGPNRTSPAAGELNYNGTCFYASPVASGIGVVPAMQFISNTASVAIATNTTALQSPFSADNDVITVSDSTSYLFSGLIEITGMSATTRTTSFGFGGTATYTNIKYIAYIGTGAANAIATVNSSKTCVAATGQVLNATVTTAAETIDVSGIMRIANAGTIIPKISHSAILGSTANCIQGSYFTLTPIGSNTGAAVGNFS